MLRPAWATVEGGSGGPDGRAGGVGEEGNEESVAGAEAWMAAALGLGLGNGGAKDVGLEGKGEPAVAVGGEEAEAGAVRVRGCEAEQGGDGARRHGWGLAWVLGAAGSLKCRLLPGEIFLRHDEGVGVDGPECWHGAPI